MTIHIYHPTDRTAVHAHSNLQAGMRFERTTDFNRALRRRFLTSVEDQRHAVAGWNFYQSTRSFRFVVLIRTADDRRQLVNYRPLFVNRKLRVTNNVDEEDMRDFEPNLLFNLGGHVMNLPENRTIDNSASRRRSRPRKNFSYLYIDRAPLLCGDSTTQGPAVSCSTETLLPCSLAGVEFLRGTGLGPQHCSLSGAAVVFGFARELADAIASAYLSAAFGAAAASFWKRGSFRSGSNIGSSRSSAGVSGVSPGIESSFCIAAMERSGSPVCAATRASASSAAGPNTASFSIGTVAIALSVSLNAAALSPRHAFVRARSTMRPRFSGCSLRKGSSSLRACRQLSWAAGWSPATSCAQPNQKRSSPLMKPNAGSGLANISFSRGMICAGRRSRIAW